MFQIVSAITDPELGAVPMIIQRAVYRKNTGEKEQVSEEEFEIFGSVHPAKMSDLALLPEEYRSETVLVIHSPIPLTLGGPLDDLRFTAPDRILCQQQTWQVIAVKDWSAFGFCKAFAVLRKEDDSA